MSIFSKILGAIPIAGPLIETGLSLVEGTKKSGQANRLQQQIAQEQLAQQRDRDALRQAVMGRLLAAPPARPDLGSLFAGSQNPFAYRSPPATAMPNSVGAGSPNMSSILKAAQGLTAADRRLLASGKIGQRSLGSVFDPSGLARVYPSIAAGVPRVRGLANVYPSMTAP